MEDDKQESGESQGNKRKKRDDRKRQYAFIVYSDSAYEDWIMRLDALHIEALISPLHDQDVNPDGSQKKPHWHVMLMFPGNKTKAQIDAIRDQVLGPNYNRALEDIQSLRGYARYLIHADNPEKAQYSKADVRALGGVDYDAVCTLPSDDVNAIEQMMQFIVENKIRYYSDFMMICAKSNREWFTLLISRKSYVIIEFIKSEAVKARDELKQQMGIVL